jgi:hypothetical protein
LTGTIIWGGWYNTLVYIHLCMSLITSKHIKLLNDCCDISCQKNTSKCVLFFPPLLKVWKGSADEPVKLLPTQRSRCPKTATNTQNTIITAKQPLETSIWSDRSTIRHTKVSKFRREIQKLQRFQWTLVDISPES